MTKQELEDYAIGFDELGFTPTTLCDFEKEIKKYQNMFKKLFKSLELLDILKEFLQDANTGTGWIEININPEHDVLDSKEHKRKQKIIKEWLDNDSNNL